MEAIVALANLAENPETHEVAFGGLQGSRAFELFVKLIKAPTPHEQREGFRALSCLALARAVSLLSTNQANRKLIVDHGGLPIMYALARQADADIQAEAATVIANVTSASWEAQLRVCADGVAQVCIGACGHVGTWRGHASYVLCACVCVCARVRVCPQLTHACAPTAVARARARSSSSTSARRATRRCAPPPRAPSPT